MGRADEGTGSYVQANTWASIYPAVWSFMLALRERGLATCLTTNHLAHEREVARPVMDRFERERRQRLVVARRAAQLVAVFVRPGGFHRVPADEAVDPELLGPGFKPGGEVYRVLP